MHLGQVDPLSQVEGLGEDLTASQDKNLTLSLFPGVFQGRFDGMSYYALPGLAVFGLVVRLPGDNDRDPAREIPADRLVSLPPHDDIMSQGQRLEAL